MLRSRDVSCHGRFSIAQARSLVQDLFTPSPWVYWTDLVCSLAVGMATFPLVRRLPGWFDWSPWAVALSGLAFGVSVCAFYRAALFTHELTHLRRGAVPGFSLAWNLLCGIPFMMPSFLYHTHLVHHTRRHYGTAHDGEYLPLAHSPPRAILWYLAQSLLIPILAVLRFLVLVPLAWLSPSLRRWVQQRASSMVIDPSFVRPLPARRERRIWYLQEACCFLLLASTVVLVALGRVPSGFVPQAYATAVAVVAINAVRTLGAHRYRVTGGEVDFVTQLVDSLNYPHRPWWNELWAPVGLRFHALHHLFPSLPYHNLARAHQRLMAHLPADSPYRRTEAASLNQSLRQLWSDARAATHGHGLQTPAGAGAR